MKPIKPYYTIEGPRFSRTCHNADDRSIARDRPPAGKPANLGQFQIIRVVRRSLHHVLYMFYLCIRTENCWVLQHWDMGHTFIA